MNWTQPEGDTFVASDRVLVDERSSGLFRFYGPEPALFDKTFTLPDVEQVK